MARRHWVDKILNSRKKQNPYESYVRSVLSGSLYRISDVRGNSSISNIHTQIDVMRALARDSQISTALSYYATDATTVNTAGQIIWATPKSDKYKQVGEIINTLFDKWNVNAYARDHILELATIGNLYIPTTDLFKTEASGSRKLKALDLNSIQDDDFDIVPSYKIPPEDIVHIFLEGESQGFILQPDDEGTRKYTLYPNTSVIHFSLGGLLGDYTIDARNSSGEEIEYDIQFARPLMENAVQPTQTLGLLEDALVLSSLIRTVKFINVECGNTDDETDVMNTLQQIKDAIEQQMSLNTGDGDVQSYVNPKSPNNLIYIPRIKGQDAISITDLNMSDATESDSKLLQYYQDKKLSVLGVPKEAMNFSSNEGLGGAGSVLSQRSALYANSLQRLKTAYMSGWRQAINTYFTARGMSGLVDTFDLHMSEIITTQSTITFEKRDAAIGQASTIVDLLKNLGETDKDAYTSALTEILSEVLPVTSAKVNSWNVDVKNNEGGVEGEF